jgi:NarL family two-component system response regulator YdfI
MDKPIRVLIADDHMIVRQGVRLILETDEGIELAGEAADGSEAVCMAGELLPDVVLMDLRMPGMDGLTAIERLRQQLPQIEIVILTTYKEDDLILRGLQAGARGYLLKDTDRQTLIASIRAAARGETLLQADIVERLLSHAQGPSARRNLASAPSEPTPSGPTGVGSLDLTEREREVLAAAARGERSKEIAHRLGITERTVKAHLTHVYNKLGVDSRAAAVAAAMQSGLLEGYNE